MRNLKRALSLALAFVMVMSLTIVGAGAVSVDDFSDGADIVNKEAVTVLATLGVITGNDDGSYAPADTISRAEMSTIICRVLNGGKDPVLGESITNTYTDTASHWAKNYIEYCTTLGIIAGKGDGTFDPEGDVTVAEAAKMVLVALGYNAGLEGYTGGAWQINVDARANPLGLYDDLSYTSTSAALTRDNAAQMLYNALDCDMVRYSTIVDATNSSIISNTQLQNTGETLLEDRFDAVKVEGVVIANEVANLEASASGNGSSLAANRTKIRIDEEASQDFYHGDETFSVSSTIDELGRYVAIYVKKDRNAVNAQVLGSVIVSEDNNVVIDASSDTIQTVIDDNDLNRTGDTLVAKNYQGLTALTNGLADANPSNATAGVQKIIIDNDDDGDVDYVLLNTYYFGKVATYVDSGDGSIAIEVGDPESKTYYNKTMTRLTADDRDDVVGFDDVAKGDYVNVQYIGGDLHVSLAESVVGVVDSYKSTAPTEEITLDGEVYQVSDVLGYTGGDDDIRMAADDTRDYVEEEVALYLDNNGYAVAFGEAEGAAGRYAMVLAKGTDVNDLVKVALADGTIGTYTVNDSGNGKEKDELGIGRVYAYSINSSDEIKLTDTDMTGGTRLTGAAKTFEKGKIGIHTIGNPDAYAYSNTAFFYVNDADDNGDILLPDGQSIKNSDVETYANYNVAPDVNDAPGVYVYEKGDRVVAVVFAGVDMVQANVEDNLYVSKIVSTNNDKTTVNAYINGSDEVQTIDVDGVQGTDVKERHTYTYTIKDGLYELSDENVTVTNEDHAASGEVERVTSNNFVLNGRVYTVSSDTLIVDHSKYLDGIVASLGGSVFERDNIIGLVEDDGAALLVVVRNEKPNTGAAGTGTDDDDAQATGTNGSVLVIDSDSVEDAAADQVGLTKGGTLRYQFSLKAPEARALDWKAGDTVTYAWSLEVNGGEYDWGNESVVLDATGTVNGTIENVDFVEGDEVKVTISDVDVVPAEEETTELTLAYGSGIANNLKAGGYNATAKAVELTYQLNTTTFTSGVGATAEFAYQITDDKGGIFSGTASGKVEGDYTVSLSIPVTPTANATTLTVNTLTAPTAVGDLVWNVTSTTEDVTMITKTVKNAASQAIIFSMPLTGENANAAEVSVVVSVDGGADATISTKGTITDITDGSGLNASEYDIKDGVLYVRTANIVSAPTKDVTIEVKSVTPTKTNVAVTYDDGGKGYLDTAAENTASVVGNTAGQAITFNVVVPEGADTVSVAYRVDGGARTVATTTSAKPGEVTVAAGTYTKAVKITIETVDVASWKYEIDTEKTVYGDTDLSGAAAASSMSSVTGLAVGTGTKVTVSVADGDSGNHSSNKIQISFKVVNGTVTGATADGSGTYTVESGTPAATNDIDLGTAIVPNGNGVVTIVITDVTLTA